MARNRLGICAENVYTLPLANERDLNVVGNVIAKKKLIILLSVTDSRICDLFYF